MKNTGNETQKIHHHFDSIILQKELIKIITSEPIAQNIIAVFKNLKCALNNLNYGLHNPHLERKLAKSFPNILPLRKMHPHYQDFSKVLY